MSENMKAIKDEALENVVGGVTRTVNNKAVGYANVRDGAGLKSSVIGTVKNGETVETTGKHIVKDGYDWYEFKMGAAGHPTAWIAGSLIGY